jgi:hypothetical protein
MIPTTQAYTHFKEYGISLLDHIVLLSFAIPHLEKHLKTISGPVVGQVPNSKFVKNDSITSEELLKRVLNAGDIIGKELLISNFSYFEAYVSDLIKEILEYHGKYPALSKRYKAFLAHQEANATAAVINSAKKLREYPKKNLVPKYQKHNRILLKAAYPMPSHRLAALGWNFLADINKNFKAFRIKDILEEGLQISWTSADQSKFENLRSKRNKIAHGIVKRYPVATAIKDGTFLHDLAAKIDQHVVKHFLLIEIPANEL